MRRDWLRIASLGATFPASPKVWSPRVTAAISLGVMRSVLVICLTLAALGPAQAGATTKTAPDALKAIGSMSVGHPNTGVLVNGVQMARDARWVLTLPSHGYGTTETTQQLAHCIGAVHDAHPGAAPVMLGSLSAQHGGSLPPHKSHRTGRDADVYFFRKAGAQWSKAATADDIDLPRTWALLRCFVTEADVEMVLIERKVQGWLEAYARSMGEPQEWVDALFYDQPNTKSAVVRHVPGHVAHMHVRFVSAAARRLAKQHYTRLVTTGVVEEPLQKVRHRVVRGDTLLGLAKRYKTRVRDIQAHNDLRGTVIKLGQALVVQQGTPIAGVHAPIHVPARRVPPPPCIPGAKACDVRLAEGASAGDARRTAAVVPGPEVRQLPVK